MSRADGLYTAVQRQVINQMLRLAAQRRQDQDRQGVPAGREDHPGPVQGLSAIRHRQGQGRPSGAVHRQTRHLETQPALPRPLHRMSYREQPSSRRRQAQGPRRHDGDACADDDPHEPHHALQSHLRRLLRGGVLARPGSRPGRSFRRSWTRATTWASTCSRCSAASRSCTRSCSISRAPTRTPTSRSSPTARSSTTTPSTSSPRSATSRRCSASRARPSSPTSAGAPACTIRSWRSWTTSARPAWCSATPAPSAGTTGRPSSATSSSIR